MRNCLIFLTTLFCLVDVNAAVITCEKAECIAVVDAGSTGSRLNVYTYDREGNNPVHIEHIYSKKISPGFASVELTQAAVNEYLNRIFAETTPNRMVPVYFYATAGMRLLPYPKQQAYYEKLKQWFSTQSNWHLAESKTITGAEEGLYGWLSVNYALGNLDSPDKELVGVMDMGGASIQVTFPITDAAVDNEDTIDLDLYGRHLRLFVHSFLGLGQNEIDKQFFDFPDCFSKGYPLPNGTFANAHWSSCEKAVSELINTVHHVDTTVKPVIESNPVNTWYAIGALGYMVQMPPLVFNHQFSLKDLSEDASREYCLKDWPTLREQYPTNDYLYTACLNTSYFYSLIVDGYGINENKPIHYFSQDDNRGDWTLGVVLHQQ